jgi:hypothetical protein
LSEFAPLPRWQRLACDAAIVLLLALAQFRMIMLVIGRDYVASMDAAQGVVNGLPHWLIYQSRVLGPYTVQALTLLLPDYRLAHIVYTILMTGLGGAVMLVVARRNFGLERGWAAFFLYQLLIALLLSKPWLYAWDQYGLILFTLFVGFVLEGRDWRWFTALFAVAIFNRESALFMALWMIGDPLVKRALGRPAAWSLLISGLFCLVAGSGLVALLRKALLVREIGPELFHLPELAGKMAHTHWDNNVAALGQMVSQVSLGFEILIPLFMLLALLLALRLAWRDPAGYLALAAMLGVMLAAILIAGVLLETRVLLELVPFVALLAWARPGAEPAGEPMTTAGEPMTTAGEPITAEDA